MILEPRCSQRRCKHLTGVFQPTGEEQGGELPACAAFPEGIPDDIAYGPNLHLVPVEGQQNEIVYERDTSDG